LRMLPSKPRDYRKEKTIPPGGHPGKRKKNPTKEKKVWNIRGRRRRGVLDGKKNEARRGVSPNFRSTGFWRKRVSACFEQEKTRASKGEKKAIGRARGKRET